VLVELNTFRALSRTRFATLTVAAVYLLSGFIGAIQVHSGNHFALRYRDKLVGAAQSSTILTQLAAGHPFRASFFDSAGNLLGATSSGLLGLFPPAGYAMAAFRGWIGGIVSVDGNHHSRLASARSAAYYVGVLLMQIIPYSLVGGAGVNLGVSLYRPAPHYSGPHWWHFPVEALRDAARIFILAIPLFFLASIVEFYFA
jgi:hypothetical protein